MRLRRSTFIIIASLAANAALIGYILRHLAAPPNSLVRFSTPTATGLDHSGKPPATDLATAFQNHDHAALRDLLKAAGFPDDRVREIVQREIWKNYFARHKALVRRDATPSASWWKNNRDEDEPDPAIHREIRKQLRELQREAEAEYLHLLGPDLGNDEHVDEKLAFLSVEKRLQLQRIEQDYDELKNEIHAEIDGFSTPADAAKLRLLKEEQKRDILAVMSPEEQKAYDLRLSETAENLRWEMTKFNATEDEYLKIFALQKAFDEKYASRNDPFGSGYDENAPKPAWSEEERSAEEAKIKQQIRALIGDERYALSIKKEDYDYRQLQAATRRFDLPADTPDRIYSLRTAVSSAALQITNNPVLSPETRKQALIQLATETRNQVRANLGPEVAEAYFKNNGMSWLGTLEEGRAVIFSKDDSSWEPHEAAEAEQPPVIKVEPAHLNL